MMISGRIGFSNRHHVIAFRDVNGIGFFRSEPASRMIAVVSSQFHCDPFARTVGPIVRHNLDLNLVDAHDCTFSCSDWLDSVLVDWASRFSVHRSYLPRLADGEKQSWLWPIRRLLPDLPCWRLFPAAADRFAQSA